MRKSDCLSPWQLDRLYYQRETLLESRQWQLHLERCNHCQQQYQTRQQDAKELRQHGGFEVLLQQGVERLAKEPQATQRTTLWDFLGSWQGLSLTSVMASLVCLFVLWPPVEQTGKSNGLVIRMLHFQKGSQYSQWTKEGESLPPGALVQFYYQIPQDRHVMIVSLDQKGTVSVFFPLGQTTSVLRPVGSGTLPPNRSLELDDNVGQERIFVVTAARSFTLTKVRQALQQAFVRAGQSLEKFTQLPRPWQTRSILIHKKNPGSLP